MAKEREIRCFDYVNHRYESVRDVLMTNATPAFSRATKRAAARANDLASQLHVTIGGLEVGTDVEISVNGVEERPGRGKQPPVTLIRFEWRAKRSPQLFPLMHAELSVYPLTVSETQLDFSGHYEPPLGVVGRGLDAMLGKRIADASIHRFVTEVAEYLRTTVN